MTHTERYCRKFLERHSDSSEKDWGSWLRAPSRRSSGAVKSRWLREDDDSTWEDRQGRVNVKSQAGEGRSEIRGDHIINMSNFRSQLKLSGTESYPLVVDNRKELIKEGNIILNSELGPDEDELIGLEITD